MKHKQLLGHSRVSIAAVWFTLAASCSLPAKANETPAQLLDRAKSVLATIEGELSVPGLREPVEILRDHWGVAHIYARNDDDLFFAQGFVVAQDRLFQIDIWRRVGLGETAAAIGKAGLEGDRFARLFKYRGPLDVEWMSYSPDTQRIATAFTRGINACIDRFGDRLPIEFQLLGYKPARWQPEDILVRMSGLSMSRNFQLEVLRSELITAVGVERARRILPTDPMRDLVPVPGVDLGAIDRTLLAGYEAATRALPFEKSAGGSNNWAIDATLSASGKPMLAGDPHRALLLPSLRYIVHLNAPGWNVIGAGEPALPGVALGHNDHVAWALTIVTTDQSDWYVEQTDPADTSRYKVGDHWEPMQIVRESVSVRGEPKPVEIELRYTRHGPVIHQDDQRHLAFVLRWVGFEPGAAAYLASLRLDRVGSAREFTEQLAHWKIPALNMTHADVDGNIGWVAAGATPVRQGWDGLLPVPGDQGKYEWQRYLSLAELPQSHNPEKHYLETANHNILPPGYANHISYEWSPPYRHREIVRRIEAKSRLTLDDFRRIQHDVTSLPGEILVRLLRQADTSRLDQTCVELMLDWDGVLLRSSPAALLYAIWIDELIDRFYSRLVPKPPEKPIRDLCVQNMLDILERPDKFWFGDNPSQGRNRLLTETFAIAVFRAKARFTGFPRQGTWGEVHVAAFTHPLSRLSAAHGLAFNPLPVARPGDDFTPNAATTNREFQQTNGASYRQVFDLADWDRGLATSTPGQSGQPGSEHYADLLPLWTEEKYFPLAFSRQKVEEVFRHRLVLKPPRSGMESNDVQ